MLLSAFGGLLRGLRFLRRRGKEEKLGARPTVTGVSEHLLTAGAERECYNLS